MRQHGLDQTELARQAGVRQGTISKILLGRTSNSRHLPRIASIVGVSSAWLLGETDDAEQDAAPASDLTHDEAKLLSNWRQLSADDRKALDRIINTMIGPKTLHAPALSYRAGDKA